MYFQNLVWIMIYDETTLFVQRLIEFELWTIIIFVL